MEFHFSISRSCLLVVLMLCFSRAACGQAWREITPLKSKRAQVERLIGPSTDPYLASYSLQDGTLFIQYSSGPCTSERKGGWNVPEGTVLLVRFVPKSKKSFASLKLELSKFKRDEGGDVGNIVNYTNEEQGVSYEVQRGRIDAIEYFPPRRYNSLKCAE